MREDTSKLLDDAMRICERSEILRKNAEWVSQRIFEHANKYTDEYIETLGYEEKEEVYWKLEELAGRLNSSINDLLKLDMEHRKIVERVNRAYGREVMKVERPLTREDIIRMGGGGI